MDLNPPYDQLVPELKLPEYAGLDDGAALARLLARTESIPWGIPFRLLATWMAGNGVRARAADAAADPNSPVRSVCLALLDALRGNLSDTLDGTDPRISGAGGMLDGLAAVGVLTADQKAELVGLMQLSRPLPWASDLRAGNITSARDLIARGA